MDELSLQYYFEHLEHPLFGPVFSNIQYPWEVLQKKDAELFEFQNSDIQGTVHSTAAVSGLVQIGNSTVIEPYVVIEGPAIIGENTVVRSHALIRPYSVIGSNVVIGHSSEIKSAIIMDEAKVASFCFVGDSVLGHGARLGSFTVTENRRFDQQEIKFKVNGQIFSAGMDKLGCVIGDYARTGGGCLIAPGTLIGKYSWIYSDTNVFGFVSKEMLVKHRQTLEMVKKDRTILQRTDAVGSI